MFKSTSVMSGVRLKTSFPIASRTAHTIAATPDPNAASPIPRAPTGVVGSGRSTKPAPMSKGTSRMVGGLALTFATKSGSEYAFPISSRLAIGAAKYLWCMRDFTHNGLHLGSVVAPLQLARTLLICV